MFNKNCCCNRQMFQSMQPMMESQVIEPTITKCVEQDFYHEVPQE